MPDKPRPGGSRDETRNTISMTRHELMDLLEDTAIKHSLKPQPTEAIVLRMVSLRVCEKQVAVP